MYNVKKYILSIYTFNKNYIYIKYYIKLLLTGGNTMEDLNLIYQQNKLLVKLLWPSLFASSILFYVLQLPIEHIVTLVALGILICGIMTVLKIGRAHV